MGVRENLSYAANPGGTILFAVTVASLLLALTVFSLRIYVKVGMSRKMSVDDWWMTAAVIQYIPYMVICAYGPSVGGTGRVTRELSSDNIEVALWTWAMGEVMYPGISFCIRMSISWFLLRLAVVKWHKRVIMAVMVGNLLISIGYLVPMTVQCVPLSYFWTRHKGGQGHCFNFRVVPVATIVHAVLGAVMDWIMALLPIAILWTVRINRRTKIAISTMLGLGVFCGFSLLLRIPFLKSVNTTGDFLQSTTGIATVAVIEPGVGIIVGSIATLQPLFKRFKFGLFHSSAGSRNKNSRERGVRGPNGEYNLSNGEGGHNNNNDNNGNANININSNKNSSGSGSGSASGGSVGSPKPPVFLTWEERQPPHRASAAAAAVAVDSGRRGAGDHPHQHRGYSIQLSTLFTSNNSHNNGTSTAAGPAGGAAWLGEHSGGSEESLRREYHMAAQRQQQYQQQNQQQYQQQYQQQQRRRQEQDEDEESWRSSAAMAEWQTEVRAGARGQGDEEDGRLGAAATYNAVGSDDKELPRLPGIAVQRDIKVVSMRVDPRTRGR